MLATSVTENIDRKSIFRLTAICGNYSVQNVGLKADLRIYCAKLNHTNNLMM